MKTIEQERDALKAVVLEFVRDVEDTGGVNFYPDQSCAPAGDEDWKDLGVTYLHACQALGKKPIVSAPDCPECGLDMVLSGAGDELTAVCLHCADQDASDPE